MADKVTFDFETGQIIFDTDTQKGVESDPELKDKKAAIMAAAGYELIDMQDFKNDVNKVLKDLGFGDNVKI
jgi:hypothetical protein